MKTITISEKIANKLFNLILKLYFYDELICPNCLRNVPNKKFFLKKGCKWCQQ